MSRDRADGLSQTTGVRRALMKSASKPKAVVVGLVIGLDG
jgi:hypothetical protein